MWFGLTGAQTMFSFAMNYTLSPALRRYALIFFDNILVYSSTVDLHLQHVEAVLKLLSKNQWYVKLSKWAFTQKQIGYLGHIISSAGVATNPSKISAIDSWPTPNNVKEVRGFLGLAGYYLKFIKSYGIICRSLPSLLKKGYLSLVFWRKASFPSS